MKLNRNLDHKKIWLDSMIGMTWGFIASLVVGSIIGLFGMHQNNGWSHFISEVKSALTFVTPFAIGVGIGIKAKMHPIQILAIAIAAMQIGHSTLIPSYITGSGFNWNGSFGVDMHVLGISNAGDVFGAWIGGVAGVYFFKVFVWQTFLDIIIVPIIGFVIGIVGMVSITYLTSTVIVLLKWTIAHTVMHSHLTGILIAPVIGILMGWALSLPTSSAAIAVTLGLHGDAATAAMAGTAAQMIAFGVMTYMATGKVGLSLAVGFGTTMLQMSNYAKHKQILLIVGIISAITAIISVAALPLDYARRDVVSGMGTSGLYGPIFTLDINGWGNYQAWLSVIFMQFTIPTLLGYVAMKLGLRFNWIKKEYFNVEFKKEIQHA